MSFTISPDTDIDTVRDRIISSVDHSEIRTSDARQRRLLKNVRRQARDWETSLTITTEIPTADVASEPGEAPHVRITGNAIEQPVTDYEQRTWDWIVQSSFGIHEVGHIRYTDLEHWDQCLTDHIRSGDKGTAHSLHNVLEDGAIEKQIINRWPNYYERLRALRANVFENGSPGIPDPEKGGYVMPVAHAVESTLFDLWSREVYDLNLGTLDALLDPDDDEYHMANQHDRDLFIDEALPLCREVVPMVLTTARSEMRNMTIVEFVNDILDILDDADSDGKSQKNGESGDGETRNGMPDDSRENHSEGETAEADQLEDIDPEDVESVTIGSGEGSDDAPDLDLDDIDDVDIDPDLEAAGQDRSGTDAQEVAGIDDDLMDEVGELIDALDEEDGGGASGGDEPTEITYPTENLQPDTDRLERSRTGSQRYAKILRNRLQNERATKTRKHQRRGRFTGRGGAIRRARLGQREIKEQRSQPDEKDYHCVFVVDRSGSMGSQMGTAEEAFGQLIFALETVGVETMLIELYGNEARLSKPFGVGVDARAGELFHGKVSGGTPLTQCNEIARQRLNREAGNRFMVIVTDDSPNNRETFKQSVQRCTFPVLGVNLTSSMDASTKALYDKAVATTADDLDAQLEALVTEVMF